MSRVAVQEIVWVLKLKPARQIIIGGLGEIVQAVGANAAQTQEVVMTIVLA